MRLKYYLRGLGIGIAVTAVLMSVAAKGKGDMTDAQIIARARELGMVDGVLTEISGPEDQIPETDKLTENDEVIQDAEKEGENPVEASLPEANTEEPDSQVDEEASAERYAQTGPESGPETLSTVMISIYPGEGSFAVSRKLAALGLVESADIYDGFLCQNGYDKKLCTGNYEIREGATAEEIARIITRSQ